MTSTLPAHLQQAIAERCRTFADEHRLPSLAYGIVAKDGIALVGGSRDTQYRIASMTKSFTAAAVLVLRNEGALALDDPIVRHVPQLHSLQPPTADSPPVTLRHLMTMASGIATDDPWADRHLDATDAQMDALFTGGATFACAPGIEFHYSNYGYAMLGRLITNVTGQRFQDFISTRLLAPLGMNRTSWEPIDARHETGYLWRDNHLQEEPPPLGDGGFASMGGLWSTVDDICRWMSFMCDAFPPRDDADPGPVRRSTRRELQQAARHFEPRVKIDSTRTLEIVTGGYAGGLNALDDSTLGRVVTHSGGLPGFGSNMCWLPDRHIGVVALSNLRYAPARELTRSILHILRDHNSLPDRHEAHGSPALRAAALGLGGLISEWDDSVADRLFADNVALDEPLDRRMLAARRLIELIGATSVTDIRCASGAEASFTLQGDFGSSRVEFLVSSGQPDRVQQYHWTLDL